MGLPKGCSNLISFDLITKGEIGSNNNVDKDQKQNEAEEEMIT